MSRVKVVVPPAPAVSLDDAKAHLRVWHDDDDAMITGYVAAAQGWLDGPGGVLGICLEPQTLEGALDEFPDGEIRLPYGPVVSVVSLEYTDGDGVTQVVAPADYVLDTYSAEAWIVPHADYSWPATMSTINAVRARWVAGEGTPPSIRHAILMLTAHYYDNRDAVAPRIEEVPLAVDALIRPWRTISI